MSNNLEKSIVEMLNKIGLTVENRLISKTKELFDRLEIKSGGIAAALNDSAKIVIFLDISCELLSIAFDESAGVKFSGFKKSKYRQNRKNLMKLMELNKKLDIKQGMLRMNISNSNVEQKALKIFEACKEFEADLDHPQYIFQSIFQACKLEKVKVAKKNFITASNLKPNQWTLLEKQFDKWVGAKFEKPGKENKKIKEAEPEEEVTRSEVEPKLKRKIAEEVEDYNVWAKRTLEKAYQEMEELKSRNISKHH